MIHIKIISRQRLMGEEKAVVGSDLKKFVTISYNSNYINRFDQGHRQCPDMGCKMRHKTAKLAVFLMQILTTTTRNI